MITVGVTGGIGSGKTTVCKIWESLGAKVFYADDEAKNLMASDPEVADAIRKTFGNRSFFPDGKLNRQHLTQEAFKKGRVEELNRIVHPAVGRKFAEDAAAAREAGIHIFVKEAALMNIRSGSGGLDYVVMVASDLEKRVQRVIERDSTDRESVLERVARQPDFEDLESSADFIIHNNGSAEDLKSASEELYVQLSDLAGKPSFDY